MNDSKAAQARACEHGDAARDVPVGAASDTFLFHASLKNV